MVRLPFTTAVEEHLAIYLEYHPHIRSYQRGDATEAFVRTNHIPAPLGTPYRINYVYEGKHHIYLPDFVGTLINGGLLIAEAGLKARRARGKRWRKQRRRGVWRSSKMVCIGLARKKIFP